MTNQHLSSSLRPRPETLIGDSIAGLLSSALDEAMKAIWEASTWMLRTAFSVADSFSTFTVDTHSGPIGAVWPTLLSVSAAVALGLFFWQLTLAVLRGGRGMMRAATGPVAYGVALAMTVTAIAAFLACADGLTELILFKGLNATNFAGAWTHTSVLGQVGNEVKAVALGLIGIFGIIPAAIGWVLEIIWRQAAILVLVATVPITAAGLLSQTTASWFWRGLRWTIAAIAVKPVLALIVVIGVSSLANATGPVGLLAGVGVLWVSLTAPIALFRLLAFVEPGTDAGQAFRESFSQFSSRFTGAPDITSGGTGGPGSSGGDSVMSAFESANTARFDAAGVGADSATDTDRTATTPGASGSASDNPAGDSSTAAGGSRSTSGSGSGADSAAAASYDNSSSTGYDAGADDTAVSPTTVVAPVDTGPAHPSPRPRPTASGSGGGSSGSGAAAATGEEAAEAAVIL